VSEQREKLDGIEVMPRFVANSPFAVKLGIEVVELSVDIANTAGRLVAKALATYRFQLAPASS
jgi:hypothetical protein